MRGASKDAFVAAVKGAVVAKRRVWITFRALASEPDSTTPHHQQQQQQQQHSSETAAPPPVSPACLHIFYAVHVPEIDLCHACSGHGIENGNTWAG